jgi:hypothetical protein
MRWGRVLIVRTTPGLFFLYRVRFHIAVIGRTARVVRAFWRMKKPPLLEAPKFPRWEQSIAVWLLEAGLPFLGRASPSTPFAFASAPCG